MIRRMGQKGKKFVMEKFIKEKIADKIIEMY